MAKVPSDLVRSIVSYLPINYNVTVNSGNQSILLTYGFNIVTNRIRFALVSGDIARKNLDILNTDKNHLLGLEPPSFEFVTCSSHTASDTHDVFYCRLKSDGCFFIDAAGVILDLPTVLTNIVFSILYLINTASLGNVNQQQMVGMFEQFKHSLS